MRIFVQIYVSDIFIQAACFVMTWSERSLRLCSLDAYSLLTYTQKQTVQSSQCHLQRCQGFSQDVENMAHELEIRQIISGKCTATLGLSCQSCWKTFLLGLVTCPWHQLKFSTWGSLHAIWCNVHIVLIWRITCSLCKITFLRKITFTKGTNREFLSLLPEQIWGTSTLLSPHNYDKRGSIPHPTPPRLLTSLYRREVCLPHWNAKNYLSVSHHAVNPQSTMTIWHRCTV